MTDAQPGQEQRMVSFLTCGNCGEKVHPAALDEHAAYQCVRIAMAKANGELTRPTAASASEVTDAMINAGAGAYLASDDEATDRQIFGAIYAAMHAARPTADLGEWRQFEDGPPPKGEMFIWARPKGDGEWALGLAYWNVSGGWSDAYGYPHASGEATHWKPIGPPPDSRAG